VLWPDHVVQGTAGAEFHPRLNVNLAEAIIRKGYHGHIDSYSGFLENDLAGIRTKVIKRYPRPWRRYKVSSR